MYILYISHTLVDGIKKQIVQTQLVSTAVVH